MEPQNQNREKGSDPKPQQGNGRSNKFPEPRAWALRWDSQNYDHLPLPTTDQDNPTPEPKSGTSRGNKFPQPRGWALRWDGDTISDIQDFYNLPNSGDAEIETDGA